MVFIRDGNVVFPKGIKCIQGGELEGFENITDVYIPDTVERIEDYEFYECAGCRI